MSDQYPPNQPPYQQPYYPPQQPQKAGMTTTTKLLLSGCFVAIVLVGGSCVACSLMVGSVVNKLENTNLSSANGNAVEGLLPGVKQFLEQHKEFGSPVKTQPIPDWAKGNG